MKRLFTPCRKKRRPLIKTLTYKSSGLYQENAAVVVDEEEARRGSACSTCSADRHVAPRVTALFAVEAGDCNGCTPLHTAICDGWMEGVAELLNHGASPDLLDASTSNPVTKPVAESPLRAAVRTGNVAALRLIFTHHPNISILDTEEGSLLHLAARSHKLEMVDFLLHERVSGETLKSLNMKGDNVTHAALQRNITTKDETPLLEILRMFFEAGVDVNAKNNLGETPLFLACRRRLPKCTELLLSFGADPLAITEAGQSAIHGACHGGCAASLTHLLSTGRVAHLVTAPDNEGVQPFHHAIKSSSLDCCEILLKNGDHLTHIDLDGTSRCSLLLQYFPTTSTQLLTRLFNSYITLSDDAQYDRNSHIIFDYSKILFNRSNDIQSSLLEDINYLQKDLLQHPLVESFVHLKWRKVRFLFYGILLSFFVFILLHTVYILGTSTNDTKMFNRISNMWAFRVVHLVMYIVILWPEVITIIANPKTYIRHWETLTKATSLSASAYVVFAHQYASMRMDKDHRNITLSREGTEESPEYPIRSKMTREISAVSVFFGWIELMMLCGRLPILGSQVLMFARIAKSAIKFIAAFIGLLVGFSASFMVLFSDKDDFRTFGTSFVKTLMMMIGEVDYSNLVDKETAVISYLILVLFLFLVCILMANLLIGLAVDDIYYLQRIGNIERRSKQATHIVTFEKAISVAKRYRLLPRSLTMALIKLYTTKSQKKIFINKNRELVLLYQNKIPSQILQEALQIAKTNQLAASDNPRPVCENRLHDEDASRVLLQEIQDLKNMILNNNLNSKPMLELIKR
ncbi:transient receptor potential channel pyrexia-like isoform X2 [Eriocheir sinensis]|uniref:transient receptor potential channel pyrexia-like isoform X2 n=1 Tax=Eriocheir sinensis TaxID=95602 RepID=UPI0021C72A5A|nr:transient receptor potential channel pyrexia-like isoform X2 [Eriocheir sinensis]